MFAFTLVFKHVFQQTSEILWSVDTFCHVNLEWMKSDVLLVTLWLRFDSNWNKLEKCRKNWVNVREMKLKWDSFWRAIWMELCFVSLGGTKGHRFMTLNGQRREEGTPGRCVTRVDRPSLIFIERGREGSLSLALRLLFNHFPEKHMIFVNERSPPRKASHSWSSGHLTHQASVPPVLVMPMRWACNPQMNETAPNTTLAVWAKPNSPFPVDPWMVAGTIASSLF